MLPNRTRAAIGTAIREDAVVEEFELFEFRLVLLRNDGRLFLIRVPFHYVAPPVY